MNVKAPHQKSALITFQSLHFVCPMEPISHKPAPSDSPIQSIPEVYQINKNSLYALQPCSKMVSNNWIQIGMGGMEGLMLAAI